MTFQTFFKIFFSFSKYCKIITLPYRYEQGENFCINPSVIWSRKKNIVKKLHQIKQWNNGEKAFSIDRCVNMISILFQTMQCSVNQLKKGTFVFLLFIWCFHVFFYNFPFLSGNKEQGISINIYRAYLFFPSYYII